MEAEADDVKAQFAEDNADTNIRLLILLHLLVGNSHRIMLLYVYFCEEGTFGR
jgi:hypothetical protein